MTMVACRIWTISGILGMVKCYFWDAIKWYTVTINAVFRYFVNKCSPKNWRMHLFVHLVLLRNYTVSCISLTLSCMCFVFINIKVFQCGDVSLSLIYLYVATGTQRYFLNHTHKSITYNIVTIPIGFSSTLRQFVNVVLFSISYTAIHFVYFSL